MPSLFKPSAVTLRRIAAEQSPLDFTYAEVGATASLLPLPSGEGRGEGALKSPLPLPPSYSVDHIRVELGLGPAVFERAKAALRRWKQFNLGWLEAFPDDTPLRAGETVLVVARAGGLWWANAARIVYTIDDADPLPLPPGEGRGEGALNSALPLPPSPLPLRTLRYGFAYGTLPGHVESGEERFLIEWDQATDRVYFDIQAFSRPRHFLVRLNRGRARAMQKRFAAEATAAMRKAAE